MSPGRLRQFVAYARKVFDLKELLGRAGDAREDPKILPSLVATCVFFCGLLRTRSFNALEPKLSEKTFQRLVGAPRLLTLPSADKVIRQLCSVDTLGRALRVADLEKARGISVEVLAKAERNKVFREGWIGALRYVAIDGWEPFSSRKQHCPGCLVRLIKEKRANGEVVEVEEYYHRYVVAMLIDSRLDLMLDFEPLLPNDLRPPGAAKDDEDEGELTTAKRLLQRVKKTFPWLDAVVADGLYPNGPFLSLAKELRMGAVIIARKEGDEPLKEALSLWGDSPPTTVFEDSEKHEHIELWDCPEIQTLSTYDGPIRVVRGRVTDVRDPKAPSKTWCVVVTGKATKLSARQVLAVARGRWHIENTGFHQWTKRWKLAHVFVQDGHAMQALYWYFFAAYNLLTLFLYRQLKSYGRDRGKDVTQTISRLVDQMNDDLARLTECIWDTS